MVYAFKIHSITRIFIHLNDSTHSQQRPKGSKKGAMKKEATTNELSREYGPFSIQKELIFKMESCRRKSTQILDYHEEMKYYLIIALTILVHIGYGQNQGQQIDCEMKEDYKKSTFKRYGRFKTFNFSSAYYNSRGRLCYIGTPRKR